MNSQKKRTLGLALLLMLCVQLVVNFQLRGPSPKPADAPLDEFSAARAFVVLQRLLGDQTPHPTGSDANARVRERLVSELEQLGLEVDVLSIARGPNPRRTLYNVLARLPNTTSIGQPLVLATHYDSVPAGPGAADAGSCVAALLETARVLQRGGPYQRPVYFLFTDGEEAGMLGASGFTETDPLAQERPFVMNFEARGTSGPSLMFETHAGNLAAARLFARHHPRLCLTSSAFVTVYRLLPNDTDFTVFQQDGWTGLNFAFIGDAHYYHTPQDNLENLSLRSLQHHGENALCLAHAIAGDGQIDLQASSEDAVFFDLLGVQVFAFPQSWAWQLALVPLIVLLLRFGRHFLQRTTWIGAVSLVTTVLLTLFLAAVLGGVLSRGLVAMGLLHRAHLPHGGWIVLLHAAVSFVLVWSVARGVLRAMPESTVWLLFWMLWSAVGVATAVVMPGFCYFTLVPALGAAVLALLPLGIRGRIVGGGVIAATVLLPLATLLPVALGVRAGVIFHPVLVLVWLPLLPLFAATTDDGEISQVNPAAIADTPPDAR